MIAFMCYTDSCFETGERGSIVIGGRTSIHPPGATHCLQRVDSDRARVALHPIAALYPYDHCVAATCPSRQPLTTGTSS